MILLSLALTLRYARADGALDQNGQVVGVLVGAELIT